LKGKILIISNSWDATSDIVALRLEGRCFRLNYDIAGEYSIQIRSDGFDISTQDASIKSCEIESVYWRKPFNADFSSSNLSGDTIDYVSEEYRYIFLELFNICVSQGAKHLVEPYAERRVGKLRQMQIAEKYFRVPVWSICAQSEAPPVLNSIKCIAKSLSSEPVASGLVMYTSEVTADDIDINYPWFLQEAIDASFDITVCYVDGSIFAYQLDRRNFSSMDWREHINDRHVMKWEKFEITADDADNIRSLMSDCGLRFGRIDFLLDEQGLCFLEVNPNGQWAWLDLDGAGGLLNCVISAISP
jgi:hypothetical protein